MAAVKALLMLCMIAVSSLYSVNALARPTKPTKSPIEHVVVLMMENRSFDHMLGWLHENNTEIDGLDGSEYNLVNVSDPNSQKVFVNKKALDECQDDPEHDFNDQLEQIYGYFKPINVVGTPKQNGFVANARHVNHSIENVMSMFTEDEHSAPIMNLLAKEFAVFDQWHCSLPGPTDPNRAYAMSGTSVGMLTNYNGTLWTQQSYFDWLRVRGIDFGAYYDQDPWAIMYFNDTQSGPNRKHIGELHEFFEGLAFGHLDQFVWLQPAMNTHDRPPNWQHPDASVREGERLIKAVYESLRASRHWNKTALIITYDEHGGFYDHVPPPQTGIPNPDGIKADNGFNFDRLGMRIPTLVISPWVEKGTVVHEPPAGPTRPTPDSQYESTSIMATTNKILNVPGNMGKRAAWAGTFEHVFETRSTPRTDCPRFLPNLPDFTQDDLVRQRAKPLNDHMRIQVQFYCTNNGHGPDCGKDIVNQGQASDFMLRESRKFMARLPKE